MPKLFAFPIRKVFQTRTSIGGRMNISVKFKALLLVSTMMLVSLGGYALLLLNMATMEQEYNE